MTIAPVRLPAAVEAQMRSGELFRYPGGDACVGLRYNEYKDGRVLRVVY